MIFQFVFFKAWSDSPLVIYQNHTAGSLVNFLGDDPAIRVVRHSCFASEDDAESLVLREQARRPQDIVVYAAQTLATHDALVRRRVRSVHFNANALIDEAVFQPSECYRTGQVCTARVMRCKRLHLLADLKQLQVIGGADDADYREELARCLDGSARFLCEAEGHISPENVARRLQCASVGLVVSDPQIEGNCRAVTEYLLCGLPVVATRPFPILSPWLIEGFNCVFADADPEGIAAAVEQAESHAWDHEVISRDARKKQAVFRRRMEWHVADLSRSHFGLGCAVDLDTIASSRGSQWDHAEMWFDELPEELKEGWSLEKHDDRFMLVTDEQAPRAA